MAQAEVRNVARSVASCGEDVLLCCKSEQDAEELREALEREKEMTPPLGGESGSGKGDVVVEVCPSDDSWARDTGPTFIISQDHSTNVVSDGELIATESDFGKTETRLVGLDWEFNGYGGPDGGCYWPCELDQAVASTMCSIIQSRYGIRIEQRRIDMVLEGGGIHTDGEGTVLATEECLLNKNRNPSMSRIDIEAKVLAALGCTKMIWLPRGLEADEDTNGHVDNLACFARPGEVVLSWTDDPTDQGNCDRCRDALRVLEGEVDARGRRIRVHKLYLPPPMFYTEEEVRTLQPDSETSERRVGQRLAASYANFYIANHGVILPQFGHKESDANAMRVMRSLFTDRKIVGVHSREILLGGGNIHCITQQVPRL